jgi:hypothetical protein
MGINLLQAHTLGTTAMGGAVDDLLAASIVSPGTWYVTGGAGTVLSVLNAGDGIAFINDDLPMGGSGVSSTLQIQLRACPMPAGRVLLGYYAMVFGEVASLGSLIPAVNISCHMRLLGTQGQVEREQVIGLANVAIGANYFYGAQFGGMGSTPGDLGLFWEDSKGILDPAPQLHIWFETATPPTTFGTSVDIRWIMAGYLYADLAVLPGKRFFPMHIKYLAKPVASTSGGPEALLGFTADALQEDNYPDIYQSHIQDNFSAGVPQPFDRYLDLGVRNIVRDDGGPQLHVAVPTGHEEHLASRYAWMQREGYLVAGQDQFVWTRHSVLPLSYSQPDTPRAPVLVDVTPDTDGVEIELYSQDNLMPAFPGANGSYDASMPQSAGAPIDLAAALFDSITAGFVASWNIRNVDYRATYALRLSNNNGVATALNARYHGVPVQAGKQYRIAITANTGGGVGTVSGFIGARLVDATGALLADFTDAVSWSATDTTFQTFYTPGLDGWLQLQIIITPTIPTAGYLQVWSPQIHISDSLATSSLFTQGGYLWGNASPKLHGRYSSNIGSAHDIAIETVPALTPVSNAAGLQLTLANATEYDITLSDEIWGLPPEWPGTLTVCARFQAMVTVAAAPNYLSYGLRFLDENLNVLSDYWTDSTVSLTTSYQVFKLQDVAVPEGTVHIQPILFVRQDSGSSKVLQLKGFDLYINTDCPPDALGSIAGGTQLAVIQTPGEWLCVERRIVGSNQTLDWVSVAMLFADPMIDTVWKDQILPENMEFEYRACTYGMLNGQLVKGPYSDVQSVGPTTDESGQRWTLWDPSGELLSEPLRFDIVGADPTLDTSLPGAVGMFSPIGANRRIASSDISKGTVFAMEINSIDEDEVALWKKLHEVRKPLIMTRAMTGEVWCVIITSAIQMTLHNTNPPMYDIHLEMEEVDVPPVW